MKIQREHFWSSDLTFKNCWLYELSIYNRLLWPPLRNFLINLMSQVFLTNLIKCSVLQPINEVLFWNDTQSASFLRVNFGGNFMEYYLKPWRTELERFEDAPTTVCSINFERFLATSWDSVMDCFIMLFNNFLEGHLKLFFFYWFKRSNECFFGGIMDMDHVIWHSEVLRIWYN